MPPKLPPLGPRAANAFGQRTGPALAAEHQKSIIATEVLEMEELILQGNGPYIEDIINQDRIAAGLPAQNIIGTLEAIQEVSRAQNAKIQALELGMTTAEAKKYFQEALGAMPNPFAAEAGLLKEVKESVTNLDKSYNTLATAVAGDRGAVMVEAADKLLQGLEDATKASDRLHKKLAEVVDAARAAEKPARDAELLALEERIKAAEAYTKERLREQQEKHDIEVKHMKALYGGDIRHLKDLHAADVRTAAAEASGAQKQLQDKVADLEARLSYESSTARKNEQQCREALQTANSLQEELGRKRAMIDAQNLTIAENASSRETLVGNYREAIGVLRARRVDKVAELKLTEAALEKPRKEQDDLRANYSNALREKEEMTKKALEAMKGEFEKELEKLRGQLSAADRNTEVWRFREELEAFRRDKTQLNSEKAELERELTELRAERTHEIPLRPTPSSREQQLPATPLPVPSFARALMGPPELTPSGHRRGSALKNPKDKVRKPYILPYGSRAVSVLEDSDEETSAGPAGFAGGLAAMPGPSSSSPSSAGGLAAIPGSASPAGSLAATPGLSSRAGGLTPIPPRAAAPVPVPGGASLGLLAAAGLVLGGVSPSSVSGGLGQLLASFAATPVSFLAGNSAAPSPALTAVGSPHTMPTPVEFVATGSLNNGELADTVSTSVLELTSAQIAEWRIKGGLLWMRPYSKKPFCVAVKISRAKTPKWPENSYYDPANDDPEFACPICMGNHSPCLWSCGGLLPRVLPLPLHARAPSATPETAGYYTTAVTE